MAYTINKFNGEELVVLEDGTIDTTTSVGLVGRNYVGYGETQNENFVFLLENFANDAPPSRPLKGQLWYNTSTELMNIYNGSSWAIVGPAELSDSQPENSSEGTLWLRTVDNTLHVWTGIEWAFIGPESVPGFGTTKCRSAVLKDTLGRSHAVIFLEVNNTIIGICTSDTFTIDPSNTIPGVSNNLVPGINLSTFARINGSITGNAENATRLENVRLINGVAFDGQQNITITALTTKKHVRGNYLTGNDFNGSDEVTWSVDATSSNTIGKVVVRDSAGNFSAGTITANLSGDVTSTGTSKFNIIETKTLIGDVLSGNAYSATRFETPRRINGVLFNGTEDIVVDAQASTLTGDSLNPLIVSSNLQSVGTLNNLSVSNAGISIGSANQLRMIVDSGTPTIRSNTGQLNLDIGESGPDISFVNSNASSVLGGPNAPAIVGDNTTNLGIPGYKFDKIYANEFKGNSDTATSAITSTNIAGGGIGSIPYQSSAGTTTFLNIGADGFVLRSRPSGPSWEALFFEQLNRGTFLNFVNTNTGSPVSSFNSTTPVTISVNADSTNLASTIVARDSSGNFSAGTINANVVGDVTGVLTGKIIETIFSAGTTGTSFVPNWNSGNVQTVTANSNFTLQPPVNMPVGSSMTIIINQDSSGNRVMNTAAGYKFASGFKTLSVTPNSTNMLNIFRLGSDYLATLTTGYQ